MPVDADRFRFRRISPTKTQRLAFKDSKVVEVKTFEKQNGVRVTSHKRLKPGR